MKHRILGMAAPQGQGRKWYEIKNAAQDSADVYIYDAIAWWGVTASQLVQDLNRLDAKTINVHINSPGGDVFEAWAIYQAIRSHKARVIVHIDSLAASAASVIALAGDEIRMARGAFFMIHRAWVVAVGDADELRKTIDMLLKVEGGIESLYADKSNLSLEEIRAAMAEETWYSASEAMAAGFVDMIVDGNDVIQNHAGSEIMAMYRNTPQAVARAAQARSTDTPAPPKTVREFEDRLRDMGYSNAAAKSIAASGFKASEPRDEDGAVAPVPEPRDEDGAAEVDSETVTALALLNARLATRRVARHN